MIDSVFNPEPTSTGIRLGRRMIGYSVAIRSLDTGRYDRNLAKGMEILACIMEAVESGWLELNIEKQIIVWRWLLAAVFITEEREKNGTVDVPNDQGGVDTAVIYSGEHGAISVYPGVNICSECVDLCNEITANRRAEYRKEAIEDMATLICVGDQALTANRAGAIASELFDAGYRKEGV